MRSFGSVTALAVLAACAVMVGACATPAGSGSEDDGGGRDVGVDEPRCGDGEVQEGEECDDDNTADGDGCSSRCALEAAELCAPCESDAECGREQDWCVRVADERVCARDCSQEACPTGYACTPVTREDGRIGGQCLPESGVCGGCVDADGDGVCNEVDQCAEADDSLDADADGVPDACDVCADGDDESDADADGVPDACDVCATGNDESDADADGVPDACDACPAGDDAVDGDADEVADACDTCPTDPERSVVADGLCFGAACAPGTDPDGDGVCSASDVCASGDDRVDADGDGVPDACDRCPTDPDRDTTGDGPCFGALCESGDDDGDTICNDVDRCLTGDDRLDGDIDGTPNACDACPSDRGNDSDGDGSCDSADICPGGDDTLDADADGTCDAEDLCPEADDRLDGDGDGAPDACDLCPLDAPDDSDDDGVCDTDDVCADGPDTPDSDGDTIPDACDPCPDEPGGDADGDGRCGAADLCPEGDDRIDADADGVPDACEPDRGSYLYERVALGGLGEQAAVTFHPDQAYALLLQRTEIIRVFDTATQTVTPYDPPGSGTLYWLDVAFDPTGSTALLVGYRFTSPSTFAGVVYRFDHATFLADGLSAAVTALAPPAAGRYVAVEWDRDATNFVLLAATGSSPYTMALRRYSPHDDAFTLIGAQPSGAGCNDFAFVNNEFGDPGILVVCGENGYDALYWTVVGGVPEWRTDLGNNALGNTSRVAAHPSGDYALAICWSCDAVYRFEAGRMNGYSEAPRFSTRRLFGVEFAPDGRRALVFGQLMSISSGTFFVVVEYRHDEYACASALTASCDLTEVSIQNASAAPWIAPSNARIADIAWRSDCDGGLIVGGNSSFSGEYGLVATFELEGGRSCW